MKLAGTCHCGAIHYQLRWPDTGELIPARRCTCSYCTRFNGTWTSHPDARLKIVCEKLSGPGRYRFGTETADFLFCQKCGVTVAAVCEIDGSTKAVLNIATLDDFDRLEFDHGDSTFDGESVDQRLERRLARWIGDVIIA